VNAQRPQAIVETVETALPEPVKETQLEKKVENTVFEGFNKIRNQVREIYNPGGFKPFDEWIKDVPTKPAPQNKVPDTYQKPKNQNIQPDPFSVPA